MSLRVEVMYEQPQIPATCVICGRGTAGRFSPPIRYILCDDDEELGDVCERCAYGSTDLWRVALIEYAIRLETQAAILRDLTMRLDDAQPAPEGIAQDILREHAKKTGSGRSGNLPPWLGGGG